MCWAPLAVLTGCAGMRCAGVCLGGVGLNLHSPRLSCWWYIEYIIPYAPAARLWQQAGSWRDDKPLLAATR
jgi:hypothetical protein